jgi:hypothetical protein
MDPIKSKIHREIVKLLMQSTIFHDFVRRTQGLPTQQQLQSNNQFGKIFIKEFIDGANNLFRFRK